MLTFNHLANTNNDSELLLFVMNPLLKQKMYIIWKISNVTPIAQIQPDEF